MERCQQRLSEEHVTWGIGYKCRQPQPWLLLLLPGKGRQLFTLQCSCHDQA